MSAERWVPIPGYEGAYEVSDMGRVRSIPRVGYRRYKGVLLRQHIDSGGYPTVNPKKNNRGRRARVHTLVLLAFVGPRPDGLCARHLNDVKTDNRLANLRYGTYAENAADTFVNGGRVVATTHCGNGHELTPENKRERRGRWDCRACESRPFRRARKALRDQERAA